MEPKKSAFSTALKYAIITALAVFIFSLIMYVTNLYLNQGVQWVSMIILLAGLFFTIRDRRDKDLGGFITFGQAFSAGFLFCILTGVLGVVSNYIMTSFIAQDMIPEMLKQTEQGMIDKGMTDEQIEMGMDMTRKFMTPVWMGLVGFLFTAFIGAIASLIMAAILKKDNPTLQHPQ